MARQKRRPSGIRSEYQFEIYCDAQNLVQTLDSIPSGRVLCRAIFRFGKSALCHESSAGKI